MTFHLPDGWNFLSLAAMAGTNGLVADGDWIESKDQDPNGDVRLIQLADIGDGIFQSRSARFLTSAKARDLRCTMLKAGDLLIARMPDPLGRACLFPGVGQPSITAVDIFVWRAGENAALPKWVMYAINSPEVREHLQTIAGGTTRQRVSGGNLKRLELPVPPKSMQGQIVEMVDRLLLRTRYALSELQHIPSLVERYKQAALRKAYCEAEALVDEPTPLAAAAVDIRNGLSRKPQNVPPGIPILKISAVRAMAIRLSEMRYYQLDAGEDIERYLIQDGDLLFTRYNGNPGLVANCGVVRCVSDRIIYPDKLIRVRLDQRIAVPTFVEALSSSPQARAALEPHIKSAAGQHGISGADLKRLPLPLPSLDQQREIVDRLKGSFSAIDTLASETLDATNLIDRLEKAILAKAFCGELIDYRYTESPSLTMAAE